MQKYPFKREFDYIMGAFIEILVTLECSIKSVYIYIYKYSFGL